MKQISPAAIRITVIILSGLMNEQSEFEIDQIENCNYHQYK